MNSKNKLPLHCVYGLVFGHQIAEMAVVMLLVVYNKAKTGTVSRVRTSLSAVTNMAQLPFAFDYEGRAPFDEASGRDVLGNHPLSHFYEAENGWLFIDSDEQELERLEKVEGLQGITGARDRQAFLETAFIQASVEYWESTLRAQDIAVAAPNTIETLREKYSRLADGTPGTHLGSYSFSIYPDHPSGHRFTQIDHYSIRPTEASIKAIRSTEKFGHSTREILGSVGYGADEIDSMIERNVAGLQWGNEFLPS